MQQLLLKLRLKELPALQYMRPNAALHQLVLRLPTGLVNLQLSVTVQLMLVQTLIYFYQ